MAFIKIGAFTKNALSLYSATLHVYNIKSAKISIITNISIHMMTFYFRTDFLSFSSLALFFSLCVCAADTCLKGIFDFLKWG